MQPISPLSASPLLPDPPDKEAMLRDVAQKLESQFMSEMLRHAGLGETGSAFSGGIGEEQYASFLRERQAATIVRAGGFGLAESIYNALKERA